MPSSKPPTKKKYTKQSTTVKRSNPYIGKTNYRKTNTKARVSIPFVGRFPKSKPLTSKNLQAHLNLLAAENANKAIQAKKKIKPSN
jgi:hypothetical protein